MVAKDVPEFLEKWRKSGKIFNEGGAWGFRDSSSNRFIPLTKSDGSSLYLCRDIVTIFKRKSKYDFQEIFYVVGNEQRSHFEAMKNALRQIDRVDLADSLEHVRFRKVKGMSTRKGKVRLFFKKRKKKKNDYF